MELVVKQSHPVWPWQYRCGVFSYYGLLNLLS